MHKKVDESILKKLLFLLLVFILYTLFQIFTVRHIFNESVRTAFSENIYYELSNYFGSKYKGGKILAKDEFLINWLQVEDDREVLNHFLSEKTELLGCSAIDIVSSKSLTAYQFTGTIETLEEDDDADQWYYDLINSGSDSSNEVYYDLSSGVLYIYLNELIYSESGEFLGVLGILIEYNQLATLLGRYEDSGIIAYLINSSNEIYLHPDQAKIGNVDIYDYFGYLQKADLNASSNAVDLNDKKIFTIDGLEGMLVIEADNSYLFNRILSIIMSSLGLYILVALFIVAGNKNKQ